MRKLSLLPVFILALMLVPACGGDDDDDDTVDYDADTTPTYDAAPVIDYDAAPAAITDEYIDETCSAGTDCGGLIGTDYACLIFNMGDATGICASSCTTDADCMDNYDGPSTGMPQCVLQVTGGDTFCGIVCTSNADCPGTHTCTDLGGVSICYANQA